MELIRGQYTFRCTVVDPYGYTNSITKNVRVEAEANNKPEVKIVGMGAPRMGAPHYMDARSNDDGRIITLKCPFIAFKDESDVMISESCDPPSCPTGWTELAISREVIDIEKEEDSSMRISGNTVRFCIE